MTGVCWRLYGGLPIEVRGPRAVVDRAASFFGPGAWRAEPAPDALRSAAMTVALSEEGDAIRCAGDALLAGDFVGEVHQVFAELEARVLIAALGRLPNAALHGAVVAFGDDAWLLVAEHAVGKTTTALALALCCEGAAVLGDDVAILDGSGVTAFERPLRLRVPTVELLGLKARMDEDGLWDTADQVFRVAPLALAPFLHDGRRPRRGDRRVLAQPCASRHRARPERHGAPGAAGAPL
jgi:hypothetical protein